MELWIGIMIWVGVWGILAAVTFAFSVVCSNGRGAFPVHVKRSNFEEDSFIEKPKGIFDHFRRAVAYSLAGGVLFSITIIVFSASCSLQKQGGTVRSAYLSSSRVLFEDGRRWSSVPTAVIKKASAGSELIRTSALFGYAVNGEPVNGFTSIVKAAGFTTAFGMVSGLVIGLIPPSVNSSKTE